MHLDDKAADRQSDGQSAPQVFGIDFTSAPRPRKPITVAVGELRAGRLKLRSRTPAQAAAFEACSRRPGPWVGG